MNKTTKRIIVAAAVALVLSIAAVAAQAQCVRDIFGCIHTNSWCCEPNNPQANCPQIPSLLRLVFGLGRWYVTHPDRPAAQNVAKENQMDTDR